MYKPLPKNLTIKESEIEGLGLFATEEINQFEVLGVTHVFNTSFEDNYIRTPLGGFFNHSKTPNAKIVDLGSVLILQTIKKINKGDEITAFYTLYNPET
jgi:SET domain-containing protein